MISVGDFDSFTSYSPGLKCSWLLEAPVNKVFKFHFLNLDLEASGQDKLEFYEESPLINESRRDNQSLKWRLFRTFQRDKPSGLGSGMLQRFIGEPRPFLSSGNRVRIEFMGSQKPMGASGFQLIYQQLLAIVRSCPIGTRRCRSKTACYNLAQTCDGELHCNDGQFQLLLIF